MSVSRKYTCYYDTLELDPGFEAVTSVFVFYNCEVAENLEFRSKAHQMNKDIGQIRLC